MLSRRTELFKLFLRLTRRSKRAVQFELRRRKKGPGASRGRTEKDLLEMLLVLTGSSTMQIRLWSPVVSPSVVHL